MVRHMGVATYSHVVLSFLDIDTFLTIGRARRYCLWAERNGGEVDVVGASVEPAGVNSAEHNEAGLVLIAPKCETECLLK